MCSRVTLSPIKPQIRELGATDTDIDFAMRILQFGLAVPPPGLERPIHPQTCSSMRWQCLVPNPTRRVAVAR